MKRILPLLLAALALLCLTGCENPFLRTPDSHPAYIDFDPEAEGIVDVETEIHFPTIPEGVQPPSEAGWYTLASSQRIRPAEPFETDETNIWRVPPECFECYIDQNQNKILNRLVDIRLLDRQDAPVDPNKAVERLLHCLAQLEHDMMSIEILETGGEYFAYVELNVNWWSPCRLFYYDRNQDRLVELYTWNDERVVGLRLRNLDNIGA